MTTKRTAFYIIYNAATGAPIVKGSCPGNAISDLVAHLSPGEALGEVSQDVILSDDAGVNAAALALFNGTYSLP